MIWLILFLVAFVYVAILIGSIHYAERVFFKEYLSEKEDEEEVHTGHNFWD